MNRKEKQKEKENIEKLQNSILQQELVSLGYDPVSPVKGIKLGPKPLTMKDMDRETAIHRQTEHAINEECSVVLCAKCCTTVSQIVSYVFDEGVLVVRCGLCATVTATIKVAAE